MALYTAGDKFGVTAANRFVKAEGGGGTPATGEVRLNDVSGTYTWQRYNGASWDDINTLVSGNTDQYLRGDKTWKCAPINYTGEVVIDTNNAATIMVKIPSAVSSVKLKMVGGTFPTWNYTEVGAHTHSGTFASSTHTHSVSGNTANESSHTHSVSGNTANESSHTHAVNGTSGNEATHTHSVSGTSGAEAAHTHTLGSHTHTFSGTNDSATGSSHYHTYSGTTGDESQSHTHDYSSTLSSSHTTSENSRGHTHSYSGDSSSESSHIHSVTISGTTGSSSGTSGAGSSHTHSFSATSGAGGSHNHSIAITSAAGAAHLHSISLTSAAGAAHLHSLSLTSGTPSATGSTSSAGISGYVLNDTAKTTITDALTLGFSTDNSTWTSKTKSDFASIANINNATGTDELNITTLVTANSFNYIKFSEPTAKKGGKILFHIEILG